MRGKSSVTQSQNKRGAEATQRTVKAYKDVFGREDESVEIVLTDLAEYCGFYQVTDAHYGDGPTKFAEGRRSVFGHILGALRMSEDRLKALENTARDEAIISARHTNQTNQEG